MSRPPLSTAIRQAAAFLALFGVVWTAADAMVGRAYRDPAAEKYALLFAPGEGPMRQLWGTSHVVHGVSPCGLADDVANLAFHAATTSFYRAWYAAWRQRHPAPRTLYFGLDAFVYLRYPWARTFAQDSTFWPWGEVLARLRPGDPDAATVALNRFALVRYRDEVQQAFVGSRTDVYRMRWEEACRGFVPLAPRPPATPAPARPRGATTPRALREAPRTPDDPTFVADLAAVLDALRRDRVRVVAFQPPYHGGATAAQTETNRGLAAMLQDRRIPFLDYNGTLRSALNDDATLFVDSTHLNADGAARFTARLAADLRARGEL